MSSSTAHTRQTSDSSNNSARHLLERSNSSGSKTPITINVYDLLPPGKISTIFWYLGVGLLHTGVAIGEREFAFGGHDRRGITGVYWMKPQQEPPGGTFRTSFIHAYTTLAPQEVEQVLHKISEDFQGTSYNVLTKNCNHFTSELCERLTGSPVPKWINRAAGIGVSLPCIVPQDWITPPECEEEVTLRPEDMDDDSEVEERSDDEIDDDVYHLYRYDVARQDEDAIKVNDGVKKRSSKSVDESGRVLPLAERANMEHLEINTPTSSQRKLK